MGWLAAEGLIGAGWHRSQPETLCRTVQTSCQTPSSYSETSVSGHEPAGVRRSIAAARQPDRLVHRRGDRGVARGTANHARRAAALFDPGDLHGADDARGLRSRIAADRRAHRLRRRTARPRSRRAGSLDWSSRCIGTRRKLQLYQQYDAILRAVGGTVCAQCRLEWRQ